MLVLDTERLGDRDADDASMASPMPELRSPASLPILRLLGGERKRI